MKTSGRNSSRRPKSTTASPNATVALRAAWVLPIDGIPISNGVVTVHGGQISAVTAVSQAGGHPLLDLGEAVLLPGLVDTHCHLEWSLMEGLIPKQSFARWLGAFLPIRDRMRPEDPLIAARWAALQALTAGTTTLADSGPAGVGVRSLVESGQRGIVHLEAFGNQRGDAARANADQVAGRIDDLAARTNGRVHVGVSPHAPYSVGPEVWRALLTHPELAKRRVATHLAESHAEFRAISAGQGALAALFRRMGWGDAARWDGEGGVVARVEANAGLTGGMVAAHCVHVNQADAERLAERRVSVAHCPTSNRQLHCGRAPVAVLRRAGVTVTLGTDSPASAGPYDLRAEARTCRRVHASAREPLAAKTLVEMMTVDGASALGLADMVGVLRPGMRADIVAFSPGPEGWRSTDPYERVLDPGARATLVMVDGNTLLDANGPVLVSTDHIRRAAREAAARLC